MCTSADKSAVKFSLQSVKNKYFYREQGIGSSTEAVKSYLEGETNSQGSLAVKVDLSVTNTVRVIAHMV